VIKAAYASFNAASGIKCENIKWEKRASKPHFASNDLLLWRLTFTTLNVGLHMIAISFGISTVRGVFTCVSISMLHILDVVAGKQYDIE
jgi:hypothetical protein